VTSRGTWVAPDGTGWRGLAPSGVIRCRIGAIFDLQECATAPGATIAQPSASAFLQVRAIVSCGGPEMPPVACDVAPMWCHDGVMDLTPYVDSLRRELAVAAEAGGDEARELAERLTAPLESATRLIMLNVLSAATDEITRELAPGSVDVRLRGLDPDFVVTPPPSDGGAPRSRPRPSNRSGPPRPRPTATRAAPPASTCVCRPTSRPVPRRPRPARACRSTRGWCAPCRPRSTAAPGRVRRRRTQTIGQSITGWVR
jgi:hypothetical protein